MTRFTVRILVAIFVHLVHWWFVLFRFVLIISNFSNENIHRFSLLNESMETEMNWQIFQLKIKWHKWNSMILSRERVFLLSVEAKTHFHFERNVLGILFVPFPFNSSWHLSMFSLKIFRESEKKERVSIECTRMDLIHDILSFDMKHERACCHCIVHSVGKFSELHVYINVWNNKTSA